jgi:hypothetical protein
VDEGMIIVSRVSLLLLLLLLVSSPSSFLEPLRKSDQETGMIP